MDELAIADFLALVRRLTTVSIEKLMMKCMNMNVFLTIFSILDEYKCIPYYITLKGAFLQMAVCLFPPSISQITIISRVLLTPAPHFANSNPHLTISRP